MNFRLQLSVSAMFELLVTGAIGSQELLGGLDTRDGDKVPSFVLWCFVLCTSYFDLCSLTTGMELAGTIQSTKQKPKSRVKSPKVEGQ